MLQGSPFSRVQLDRSNEQTLSSTKESACNARLLEIKRMTYLIFYISNKRISRYSPRVNYHSQLIVIVMFQFLDVQAKLVLHSDLCRRYQVQPKSQHRLEDVQDDEKYRKDILL
ncbi:MAG: hypothetical protein HLUCCO02_11260 [Idiomarinaceae bacterium HL-53]|nr:MAG: hypothetical protein HLUCCO02_11260 [Idiomarinaceae bacterium HL-53]